MKPATVKALITGAAGGIGGEIAAELLARGAAVLLVDRDAAALARAAQRLAEFGDRVGTLVVDLTSATDRQRLCIEAASWRGGINVLVNNAGINHFCMFEDQPPEQVDLAVAINVLAPIHLCRGLLAHLRRQPQARILNTGSVFGAIGYPGYAVYSATKFAVRGFTEALRRELADTHIGVHYVAPRATRTGINTSAVERMNQELGVTMDSPEAVARAVCNMLEDGRAESVLGWPEKFFARVNGILPRVVDGALRKQLAVIRRHAQQPAPPAATPRELLPAASLGKQS
jgi:short-subunit dehydrogenase